MTDADALPDFDVVVIGAGPGGYTAAFRAADLGLKVALIERHDRLGGVCLNVGCIPSKALLHAARVITETQEIAARGVKFGAQELDLSALLDWKQSVVTRLTDGLAGLAKRRRVEVIHGVAAFTSPTSLAVDGRHVRFKDCIIAAGSRATQIPGFPDDQRIVSSTEALSPAELPGRLLVVGGGIIGLEMACVYDALGAKVTVVEALDHLVSGADQDLVRPLQRRIVSRYENVLTGARVERITPEKDGLRVAISGVDPSIFDQVLVAVGRIPNGDMIGLDAAGVRTDSHGFVVVDARLRTNVTGIYAIGDIVGEPMLAHKAMHQATVAAEVIAGHDAAFCSPPVPAVAYTDPELAWVGVTEAQARADAVEHEVARFPWIASGRALGLDRSEGLTKLITEAGGGRILGAGIVGVGAGDLISEVVLAMHVGATAEDVAHTIHPHPTLSETVGFSAEVAIGTVTDLMPTPHHAHPVA